MENVLPFPGKHFIVLFSWNFMRSLTCIFMSLIYVLIFEVAIAVLILFMISNQKNIFFSLFYLKIKKKLYVHS